MLMKSAIKAGCEAEPIKPAQIQSRGDDGESVQRFWRWQEDCWAGVKSHS